MSANNAADLTAMLEAFWVKAQMDVHAIDEFHDWKFHQLPLARIKKVMKLDEDAKSMMISAEAPIVFAKACELFILELTLRAWTHTEENKRRTLQKSDISVALQKADMYDFLIDVVPRDDGSAAAAAAVAGSQSQISAVGGPLGGMATNPQMTSFDDAFYNRQPQ